VFLRAGQFPLVVTRDDRERYITSPEEADPADLRPLVRFFSIGQKKLLTKAIGLAIDVKPATNVGEAIEATRDLLIALGQITPQALLKAKEHARGLSALVQKKLTQMSHQLQGEIGNLDGSFRFSAGSLAGPPGESVSAVLRTFGYEPDFHQYADTRVLTLKGPSGESAIWVSFHGAGEAYRGLLGVAAFFTKSGDPVALSDDIFRITYEDTSTEVSPRFNDWLEPCLVKGIGLWRRTLA
jgi:hypothetical protein